MGAVDTNRCGELKFFEGSKELDPDDVNLWDKVDSSVWIEAYDKSGENMPNYMKDLYQAGLPKIAMTGKKAGKVIVYGTSGDMDKHSNFKDLFYNPGLRQQLNNNGYFISGASRKGKQENRLFRTISKALYKAQVFLVKTTNDIFRRSRNL